jgi:hypothetical protein
MSERAPAEGYLREKLQRRKSLVTTVRDRRGRNIPNVDFAEAHGRGVGARALALLMTYACTAISASVLSVPRGRRVLASGRHAAATCRCARWTRSSPTDQSRS